MSTADWIGVASLAVASVSFILAALALRKSDNNASAATLVSLYSTFSNSWDKLRGSADEAEQKFYLAELLNVFEGACGIVVEGSLSGVSKELITKYLCHCFQVLDDPVWKDMIHDLLDDKETFANIREFVARNTNRSFLPNYLK